MAPESPAGIPKTAVRERLLLKVAAAVLAVPILAVIYVTTALRRSTLVRNGSALAMGGILAVGVVLAGWPSTATATPPSEPLPVTDAAFGPVVATGSGLDDPLSVTFSTAMDPTSVAALTTVVPPADVELSWNPSGTRLTILPRGGWAPETFHTITVAAGALARTGQPLLSPVRTAFLTRGPATATIAATETAGTRAKASTDFDIVFDQPVDPDAAAEAITLEPASAGDPAVPGTVTETGSPTDGMHYRFTPTDGLRADTRYRLKIRGLTDLEGGAVPVASLLIRTAEAGAVVRFRPRDDTLDVARDAQLSVRFTTAMDRTSTAKAFKVLAANKAVAGKITWAEGNTVLIFKPATLLPYLTKVSMSVGATARTADGVPIAAAARGLFRTVPKPVVVATAPAGGGGSSAGSGSGGGSSGGGSVGGGSWGSVEVYYLGLMNCTRTGGWVTSSGSCSSPGGRSVAPLQLSSGISSKVSRPYAKKLATSNQCTHFSGGNPGDRLRAAGYTSYRWAENLGCRSGSPRGAVLGSHLFFQSEKSYNGGHYVNMMNAAYDRVGIGVWVSGGRVRLVIDFYHP